MSFKHCCLWSLPVDEKRTNRGEYVRRKALTQFLHTQGAEDIFQGSASQDKLLLIGVE